MSEPDREWIYAIDDNRLGPVSAAEIATLISIKHLPEHTLVWRVGMAEWVPAISVPAIAVLCAPSLPKHTTAKRATPLHIEKAGHSGGGSFEEIMAQDPSAVHERCRGPDALRGNRVLSYVRAAYAKERSRQHDPSAPRRAHAH